MRQILGGQVMCSVGAEDTADDWEVLTKEEAAGMLRMERGGESHAPSPDVRLVAGVGLLVGPYLCLEPCLVSGVFLRLPRLVVSAVGVGVRRVRALCPDFEVSMRDVVVDVC